MILFSQPLATSASMFKHNRPQPTVSVQLDGQLVSLPGEMSVAAALLATGQLVSRLSPSSGRPCAPHCLMGVCYECLMEIDGCQRQACMTEVREGMEINRHLNGSEEKKHGNPV